MGATSRTAIRSSIRLSSPKHPLRASFIRVYEDLNDEPTRVRARAASRCPLRAGGTENSVATHKVPGYAIVTHSLKPAGEPPGDATSGQMEAIADLADSYSHGEIRVGHEQNLVFAACRQQNLFPALAAARQLSALANAECRTWSTDIIACPGLDYCSLANARSIPFAMEFARRFESD